MKTKCIDFIGTLAYGKSQEDHTAVDNQKPRLLT